MRQPTFLLRLRANLLDRAGDRARVDSRDFQGEARIDLLQFALECWLKAAVLRSRIARRPRFIRWF